MWPFWSFTAHTRWKSLQTTGTFLSFGVTEISSVCCNDNARVVQTKHTTPVLPFSHFEKRIRSHLRSDTTDHLVFKLKKKKLEQTKQWSVTSQLCQLSSIRIASVSFQCFSLQSAVIYRVLIYTIRARLLHDIMEEFCYLYTLTDKLVYEVRGLSLSYRRRIKVTLQFDRVYLIYTHAREHRLHTQLVARPLRSVWGIEQKQPCRKPERCN